MKVLALRADYGGCSFYRLTEPSRVLSEQYGLDIRVDIDLEVDATKNLVTKDYTVREVREDIDLLIVQRPLNRSLFPVIVQAQKQGIAVIVEIDDDFHNVHPDNSSWKAVQPKYSPHSNYEWLMKSSQQADLVSVSTPYLSKYAQPGNSVVLPNFVPESIFSIKPSPKAHRGLGWTGTVQTHPDDLLVASRAIARAANGTRTPMRVVGDGLGVANQLGFSSVSDVTATGWVDLEDYYQTIADNMSVGIVPLTLSDFNQAKSYLKGLEMAALGIPFVASGTDEYVRLASLGVGQIARTPDEWNSTLRSLLKNPRKVNSTGKNYQEIVKSSLTYEHNAHLWLDAWEQAVDRRKRN